MDTAARIAFDPRAPLDARYDARQTLTTPATRIIYALFGIGTSGGLAAVGDGAKITEGQP